MNLPSVYNTTTGAVRTVVNEIPGGITSLRHMIIQMKIGLAACLVFYSFIGSQTDFPVGERIAWYAVFFTLWVVSFAWFAAWLDNQD